MFGNGCVGEYGIKTGEENLIHAPCIKQWHIERDLHDFFKVIAPASALYQFDNMPFDGGAVTQKQVNDIRKVAVGLHELEHLQEFGRSEAVKVVY